MNAGVIQPHPRQIVLPPATAHLPCFAGHVSCPSTTTSSALGRLSAIVAVTRPQLSARVRRRQRPTLCRTAVTLQRLMCCHLTRASLWRPNALHPAPSPRHIDRNNNLPVQVGVTPNGDKVICVTSTGVTRVFDARTGKAIMGLSPRNRVGPKLFSSDEQ